jgi:hypothetical protein
MVIVSSYSVVIRPDYLFFDAGDRSSPTDAPAITQDHGPRIWFAIFLRHLAFMSEELQIARKACSSRSLGSIGIRANPQKRAIRGSPAR